MGGLEHEFYFSILGISSSQLTSTFFRGVGKPIELSLFLLKSSICSCIVSEMCWLQSPRIDDIFDVFFFDDMLEDIP